MNDNVLFTYYKNLKKKRLECKKEVNTYKGKTLTRECYNTAFKIQYFLLETHSQNNFSQVISVSQDNSTFFFLRRDARQIIIQLKGVSLTGLYKFRKIFPHVLSLKGRNIQYTFHIQTAGTNFNCITMALTTVTTRS